MNMQSIWSDSEGLGRNKTVLFRRVLELSETVIEAKLQVFADTRYRLWVNDQFVEAGPLRFNVSHPDYDTIDLSPFLNLGKNVLLIEVNQRGENSFQAEDSEGAFAALGQVLLKDESSIDLSTPGDWLCKVSKARDEGAPVFSFARSAVEIVDWSALMEEFHNGNDWQKPVLRKNMRYSDFSSRPLPYARETAIVPEALVLNSPLKSEKIIYNINLCFEASQIKERSSLIRFYTYIHAEEKTEREFWAHWGSFFLNGQKVSMHAGQNNGQPKLKLRYSLSLEKGWNLLMGEMELLENTWPIQLGLDKDLELSVNKRLGDKNKIRISEAFLPDDSMSEAKTALTEAEIQKLTTFPVKENLILGESRQNPARMVAWDEPVDPAKSEAWTLPQVIQQNEQGDGTMTLDFGHEFFGMLEFEIDCHSDCLLDVACDERVLEDGTISLYTSNHTISAADRYLLKAGKTKVRGFHNNGGRYLQISLRGHQSELPAKLLRLEIKDRRLPLHDISKLKLKEDYEYIWKLCTNTIDYTFEEGWIDTWREHGAYLGDAVVQWWGSAQMNFDESLAVLKKSLHWFARAQREDGHLPSVAPSQIRHPHGDYTLLWGALVYEMHQRVGDRSFLQTVWPCYKTIFDRLLQNERLDTGMNPENSKQFIDWGCDRRLRIGELNLHYNALWYRFCNYGSKLATDLEDFEQAKVMSEEAEAIKKLINEKLWDEEKQDIASALTSKAEKKWIDGAHGRIMALWCEVLDEDKVEAVLNNVLKKIEGNAHKAMNGHQFGDQVELYFSHYLLQVLAKYEKFDEALSHLHSMWIPHREKGVTACWETLNRGYNNWGSVCHSWSVAPLVYMSEEYFGIKYKREGADLKLRLEPSGHKGHDTASLKVSLPEGRQVEVSWEIVGGKAKVCVNTDIEEKHIHFEPRGYLATLETEWSLERPKPLKLAGTV